VLVSLDGLKYLIGVPMIGATTSADDVHAGQEFAKRSSFFAEFHRVAIVKFLGRIQLRMAES